MIARGLRPRPISVALSLAALITSAASVFGACPDPQGTINRVVDLDERLEAVLDSGTRLRFWGIEVPSIDGAAPAQAREKLLGWLGAVEVTVQLLSTVPDRWGRIEAHVYGPRSGRPPLLVSQALVDAGLARVRPEAGDPACQHYLLEVEAAARRQNLGLWAQSSLQPLSASDRQAFAGRQGSWVIVQGRVESVNGTGFATYLNFGPIRTVDFAVTVRRPVAKEMEAALGPLAGLSGRLVEVRGLLDSRFGPQVELDQASALRLLHEGVIRSPYSGRETRR